MSADDASERQVEFATRDARCRDEDAGGPSWKRASVFRPYAPPLSSPGYWRSPRRMDLTRDVLGWFLFRVRRFVPLLPALGISLALAACPSRKRTPAEISMHLESAGFSCERAAEILGCPGATLGPCNEELPGVWRVVLHAPGIGPGDAVVRTFTWRGGRLEERGGQAHLARTLASIDAHQLSAVSAFGVQVLLEATGAAPPGFMPHTVEGAAEGVAAAIRTRPFGVRLVMVNWRMPDAAGAAPGQPPRPTSPGPLGPPPGALPAGGVAPPTVAVADLELDSQYRGRWRVQVRGPFDRSFREVLVVPVRPD